jgi:hypothetical protein
MCIFYDNVGIFILESFVAAFFVSRRFLVIPKVAFASVQTRAEKDG